MYTFNIHIHIYSYCIFAPLWMFLNVSSKVHTYSSRFAVKHNSFELFDYVLVYCRRQLIQMLGQVKPLWPCGFVDGKIMRHGPAVFALPTAGSLHFTALYMKQRLWMTERTYRNKLEYTIRRFLFIHFSLWSGISVHMHDCLNKAWLCGKDEDDTDSSTIQLENNIGHWTYHVSRWDVQMCRTLWLRSDDWL